MSQTRPPRPETPPPSTERPGAWERFTEDVRARPRYYVTLLVIAGVLTAGGLVLGRHLRTSAVEEENLRQEAFTAALSREDPEDRVAELRELSSSFEGQKMEPVYLVQLARQAQQAARDARSHDAKLRYLRVSLEAIESLKSRHPNSLWLSMPWRPTPPGGDPAPSTAEALRRHAEAQIAWLEAHPYEVTLDPDPNLEATVVLQEPSAEGEPEEHRLRLQLFSKQAPYAVDNFVRLGREGYYDGTLLFALETPFNADGLLAAHFGSPMSKVAPEDPGRWTTEEDTIGYSLPQEANALPKRRGAVLAEPFPEAAGMRAAEFTILLDGAPRWDRRTAFGQVREEDLRVLERIASLSPDRTMPLTRNPRLLFPPESPWKVLRVEVEGQPAHPPARPHTPPIQLPEAPETEEEGGEGEDGEER